MSISLPNTEARTYSRLKNWLLQVCHDARPEHVLSAFQNNLSSSNLTNYKIIVEFDENVDNKQDSRHLNLEVV